MAGEFEASANIDSTVAIDFGAAEFHYAYEEADNPTDLVGSTIGERYEVIELLGSGGMGRVYKVRHRQLKRFHALKLLKSVTKEQVARFDQEAKTAGGLHHPNLVAITDYGVHKTAPYLVMDYAAGRSLDAIIKENGHLQQSEAIEIFIQICSALTYAHGKNILHRDIKPSNIMVDRQPSGKLHARLVDFGIAKSIEKSPTTPKLTQTGLVLGSPPYMSPEQCMGKNLDERSDLYSLGCVMFEALTGVPPFEGDNNMQIVFKHVNERPPLFRAVAPSVSVRPEMERIVLQALEKERSNRYQSIADLQRDLVLVQAGKNPVKEASNVRRVARSAALVGKFIAVFLPVIVLTVVGYDAFQKYQVQSQPQWMKDYSAGLKQLQSGTQSNFPMAEVYFKRALDGAEQDRGHNALVGRRDILASLSRIYQGDGQWQDAVEYLRSALTADSTLPESIERADILDELCRSYLNIKEYASAARAGHAAFEIKQRRLGLYSVSTEITVARLAQAYLGANQLKDAERFALMNLDIANHIFPRNDRPELGDACEQLAMVYAAKRQPQVATSYAERAMLNFVRLFGPTNKRTKTFAGWYVSFLEENGLNDQAESVRQHIAL